MCKAKQSAVNSILFRLESVRSIDALKMYIETRRKDEQIKY